MWYSSSSFLYTKPLCYSYVDLALVGNYCFPWQMLPTQSPLTPPSPSKHLYRPAVLFWKMWFSSCSLRGYYAEKLLKLRSNLFRRHMGSLDNMYANP